MKRFLPILLIAISFSINAQLQFTNYSNMNEVTCMLENGTNIWIGTTGGISVRNKSTGALVANYTTNNGLSNNYVSGMVKDGSGKIWVVTNYGLSIFDGTTWTYITEAESGVGNNLIRGIVVDLDNNIWLAAVYHGLTKFDGTTWTHYVSADGLPSDHVYSLNVDNGNNIWVGTDLGMAMFDGVTFTTYTTASTGGALVEDFVKKITIDNYNNVWISYNNYSGLTKFTGSTWFTYTVANTGGGLPINATNITAFDALGNLWIGHPLGITKFTGSTWTTWDTGDGMLSNSVESILIDAEGNKWAGSSSGLMRYDDANWSSYVLTNGLVYNLVNSIVSLPTGVTYFGTNAGLSKLVGTNSWTNTTELTGLIGQAVYVMAKDASNNVWMGTNSGLAKYNGTSFGTEYYNGSQVFALTVDQTTGNVWAGFQSTGAAMYNGTTWTNYTTASGLGSNQVEDIAVSSTGTVWFATTNGLTKKTGSTWYTYTTSNSGILSNTVNTVEIDNAGNIWVGTNYGAAKFNGTSTWTTYTYPEISDYYVTDIFIDNLQNVWVGTFSGFSVYDGTNWAQYDVPDGLVGEYVNAIKQNSSTNDIWVGTGNGVSKVTCVNPLVDFVSDTTCYTGSVTEVTTITNTSENTDEVTSYQWDIGNDGSVEYTSESLIHFFESPGIFEVKLTATNHHCSSSIVNDVVVNEQPMVELSLAGTVNVCEGSAVSLVAEMSSDTSTMFNENFNYADLSYLTWVQEGLGITNWYLGPTSSFAGQTAPELVFNFNPSFNGESKMISPIINTSGNSTVYLSFSHMVDHYAASYDIGVKTTSDGVTWNTVWSSTVSSDIPATSQTVVISNADVGSSNFRIAFYFNGNSYNIDNWYIDNVVLSKSPGGASGAYYTYQWSTGETTNSISIVEYGRYNVIVTNQNCVTYSDTVEVNFASPVEEQICLVTVDTASGKNLIIWEKTPTESILSYNVYKLQGADYMLLANIPYDSLSVFVDPTSQPEVHADRYKIQTVDTCGNMSDLSPFHQTINLGVSMGTGATPPIVLAWNNYVDEAGSFSPLYYYIYKGETPDAMELFDSLSFGLPTSFNVINPGVFQYYRVSVEKEDMCAPTYGGGGSSTTCQYSVGLVDSYGDGWNTNTLTITVNGTPYTYTLEAGAGPEVHYFTVNTGDAIYATFTGTQWPYENQYTIYDANGNAIFTDGVAGTTAPSANNTFVAIGSCAVTKDMTGPYSQSVSNLEDNGIAVGIEGVQTGVLTLAPNPFSDYTIITLPENEADNYSVKVTDVTGKVVSFESGITGNRYLLKRGNLESGYYFVEIMGRSRYIEKIVIK
ncbi:MAG: hypothetical protein A2W91_16240 [Bacteroidetes bacterium GWF2_38_335]|nr:MAG: hypothetical protein A2W91_16240 [Bacteroidetes bacterium GWF2_38_335]OFY81239.1 MAG: hypothetical protein A2281_07215 [Bacteroidetes bacterium RIFOXYA12_FULL_38_20]HBS85356.1 hypothetical protein [Bacteroidales bacterium]